MKTILFLLALLAASARLVFADCPELNARQAFDTRFTQQWFTDADQLDRHWVEAHTNQRLPQQQRRFCSERQSGRTAQTILDNPFPNTLAFENPLGPIGGGMCWLHSRLQRRATYLANFVPGTRPTPAQARQLIHRIASGDAVTEIPGFSNLNEFSAAFQHEFVDEITAMGWNCAANPNDCLARIGDPTHPSAATVRENIDRFYDHAERQPGDIQFMRLRVREWVQAGNPLARPFLSHSMLLLSIEPIAADNRPIVPGAHTDLSDVVHQQQTRPRNGYQLRVIDPNSPSHVETLNYHYGDDHITTVESGSGEMTIEPVPHYEYEGDIPQMRAAIDRYCRG